MSLVVFCAVRNRELYENCSYRRASSLAHQLLVQLTQFDGLFAQRHLLAMDGARLDVLLADLLAQIGLGGLQRATHAGDLVGAAQTLEEVAQLGPIVVENVVQCFRVEDDGRGVGIDAQGAQLGQIFSFADELDDDGWVEVSNERATSK